MNKSSSLSSVKILLEINIKKDFINEVIERIFFFFNNKLNELGQTTHGVDFLKLSAEYCSFNQSGIYEISDDKIRLYKSDIISFLNPVWYSSREKKLSSDHSDMINHIFIQLCSKLKYNPDLISGFLSYNRYVKNEETFIFLNLDNVNFDSPNFLKVKYLDKLSKIYFDDLEFSNYKNELISKLLDLKKSRFKLQLDSCYVYNKSFFDNLNIPLNVDNMEIILDKIKDEYFCKNNIVKYFNMVEEVLILLPSIQSIDR